MEVVQTATVPNDGITTKRDGSKRDKGLYLFNVNDSKILFVSYTSVQVTKKKKGNLDFGTKYTHTYSVITKTGKGRRDLILIPLVQVEAIRIL